MADEFVFVYGTLRKGQTTAMSYVLARHCEFVADGFMQGRLYEVAGYPGVVESCDSTEKVFGELYRLVDRDLVLRQLDEYEECTEHFPEPHEYVRKKLLISRGDGGTEPAWVYVYNRGTANLLHIKSGDYLEPSGQTTQNHEH